MFTLVKRTEDLMSTSSRSLITLVVSNKIRYPQTVSSSHRNVPANEVSWWKLFRSEDMRRLIYSEILCCEKFDTSSSRAWYQKNKVSIFIWRLATDTCCTMHAVVGFLALVTFESWRKQLRFMFKLLGFMLVSSQFEWVDKIVKSLERLTKSEKTNREKWVEFVCWIQTWRLLCSVTF